VKTILGPSDFSSSIDESLSSSLSQSTPSGFKCMDPPPDDPRLSY